MREIQRRALLTAVRAKGEASMILAVQPLLTKRFKQISRELRRANLRKRLRKNERDTGSLFKQGPEDDQEWQEWIDEFAQILHTAMLPVVVDAYDAETKFWLTRQLRPDPVNPETIIQQYLARDGRQIKNIADNVRDDTLSTITDWYNTDAGLAELIDSLEPIYGDYRAETIARTESTFITSGVSMDMMRQFDVPAWTWDLADEDGDWPCDPCREMAAMGPYQPGDEMPPLHPRCRCGMVYANADGSELIYKVNIPRLTTTQAISFWSRPLPAVAKEFNPDQPRDSHGRFAPGGAKEEATGAARQGPQFQMSPERPKPDAGEVAQAAAPPAEAAGVAAQAPDAGPGAEAPTEPAPAPAPAKSGGSYRTVHANAGAGMETNHMPAYEASNLKPENGPAIAMTAEDHYQTASYGNGQAAKDYREAQRLLIHQGRFREAQMMDVEDIQRKFGNKYDDQIRQMIAYTNRLTFSAKHGLPLNPTRKQIRSGRY